MEESQKQDFNPEQLNEGLLKTTAITFSLEGLSRDLEVYIQKKITLNNRNFKHVSDIVRSISSCDVSVQKEFFKKGASITKMLDRTMAEIASLNDVLTDVIQKMISREKSLINDLEEAKKEESNS